MLNYHDNGRIVGFALANAQKLEAIASKPMASFATAFVKAYLKAKTSSLDDIKAFGNTVGLTTLLQSADKLSPAEALSLVKRIDPANSAKAVAEPTWMRGHLVKLLSGDVVPAPIVKAEKAPKKAAPRKRRSVMDETDAFAVKRPSRARKND
jgi:hypothetical protein